MDWLIDQINKFWLWLSLQVSAYWTAFTEFLYNLIYSIIDVQCSIFETVISSIPVPAAWSNIGSFNFLPSSTLYLLNALGFPYFVAIIGGAYIVRFALNLIPAALTRV